MIKIAKAIRTCEYCPAQWDMYTEDNRYLYCRYRWGYLAIRYGVQGPKVFAWDSDDETDGFMSNDRLMELTKNVLDFSSTTWEER